MQLSFLVVHVGSKVGFERVRYAPLESRERIDDELLGGLAQVEGRLDVSRHPHFVTLLHFIREALLELQGLLEGLHEYRHILLVLLPLQDVGDLGARDGCKLKVDRYVHTPILREDGRKLLIEVLDGAHQPSITTLRALKIVVLTLRKEVQVGINEEPTHPLHQFVLEFEAHRFDSCTSFLHVLRGE